MKNLLQPILYNRATAALARKYYDRQLDGLESLIFVATTGRSGTLTLVDMLRQIDGCVAYHEPYPAMHDTVLAAAARGDYDYVKKRYLIRKSVNIRRAAGGARHYIEANHLFVKTFIQFAVEDFGEKIRILHLVRHPAHVANSIYSLTDQPGTVEGNRWWLDYRAPTNLLAMADLLENDPEFCHPYYKGLWYWFEVESRIALWQERLPHIPFTFFQTEHFNNAERLTTLLHDLQIQSPPGFVEKVTSIRSHTRHDHKKSPPLPDESAQEMLTRFLALLNQRGDRVPETVNAYL